MSIYYIMGTKRRLTRNKRYKRKTKKNNGGGDGDGRLMRVYNSVFSPNSESPVFKSDDDTKKQPIKRSDDEEASRTKGRILDSNSALDTLASTTSNSALTRLANTSIGKAAKDKTAAEIMETGGGLSHVGFVMLSAGIAGTTVATISTGGLALPAILAGCAAFSVFSQKLGQMVKYHTKLSQTIANSNIVIIRVYLQLKFFSDALDNIKASKGELFKLTIDFTILNKLLKELEECMSFELGIATDKILENILSDNTVPPTILNMVIKERELRSKLTPNGVVGNVLSGAYTYARSGIGDLKDRAVTGIGSTIGSIKSRLTKQVGGGDTTDRIARDLNMVLRDATRRLRSEWYIKEISVLLVAIVSDMMIIKGQFDLIVLSVVSDSNIMAIITELPSYKAMLNQDITYDMKQKMLAELKNVKIVIDDNSNAVETELNNDVTEEIKTNVNELMAALNDEDTFKSLPLEKQAEILSRLQQQSSDEDLTAKIDDTKEKIAKTEAEIAETEAKIAEIAETEAVINQQSIPPSPISIPPSTPQTPGYVKKQVEKLEGKPT